MSEFITKELHDLQICELKEQLEWYRKQYNDLLSRKTLIRSFFSVSRMIEDSKEIQELKRRQAIHLIAEEIYPLLENEPYVVSQDEFNNYYQLQFVIFR